jgi:tetratricopeptide (TPR) repeat protein
LLASLATIVFAGEPKTPDEYQQVMVNAGDRGDWATMFSLGRQMTRAFPNEALGYQAMLASSLKSKLTAKKDMDDLEVAIREYRRRKLGHSDSPAVMTALRQCYVWRSQLAINRGDFSGGMAELARLSSLGDSASRAQADLERGGDYINRYVRTKSLTDAREARDAYRRALENPNGLKEVAGDAEEVLGTVHFAIGAMENDLGNYKIAVAELEAAQRLDPRNADTRETLATARANLNGGGGHLVSLGQLFGMTGGLGSGGEDKPAYSMGSQGSSAPEEGAASSGPSGSTGGTSYWVYGKLRHKDGSTASNWCITVFQSGLGGWKEGCCDSEGNYKIYLPGSQCVSEIYLKNGLTNPLLWKGCNDPYGGTRIDLTLPD